MYFAGLDSSSKQQSLNPVTEVANDLLQFSGADTPTAVGSSGGKRVAGTVYFTSIDIGTNLDVGGAATADSLDTNTATTLTLGESTATKVEIADTGVTTEVQGDLEVEGDIDTSTATTITLGGDAATKVEIADTGVETEVQGDLEVEGDIDTIAAGTLTLGGDAATKVEIADTGVETEIQGDLEVEGDIDTIAAGTLTLGGDAATKVEIADSGVETEIQGDLEVQGNIDTIAAGTLTLGGDAATKVEIADSGVTTEVQGELDVEGVIDTVGASTLEVGKANATAVTLGDVGVNTTAEGDLAVDENFSVTGTSQFTGEADFDSNITIAAGKDIKPDGQLDIAAGQAAATVAGAALNMTGGEGGDSDGLASAGVGGAVTMIAGKGGDDLGNGYGNPDGGDATVAGGAGADGDGSTAGGDGGDTNVNAGAGGADGGFGAGADGILNLGGESTSAVNFGNVTDNPDFDFLGTGDVKIEGGGDLIVGTTTKVKSTHIQLHSNTSDIGTTAGDLFYRSDTARMYFYDTSNATTLLLDQNTTFGGDVSGTYGAIAVVNDSHTHGNSTLGGVPGGGIDTAVTNLRGYSVESGAPTTDEKLIYTGSSWTRERTSRVRAYRSGNQTLGNSVTKVQFNAETYDTRNEFDPSTNYRFTCIDAGYYLVQCTLEWSGATDALYDLWIYRNGASVAVTRHMQAASNESTTHHIQDVIYLTASQYIEIYARNYSGATGVDGGSTRTHLEIHKMI